MEQKKIFFNGLNELRAFAALLVIFHHIELFKNRDHTASLLDIKYFSYFIEKAGKNGVYLFFVLSGFLITFLLLKEKEKLNTIQFKKFYLRRIFRIWPLYYLIILIGFVIIPFLAHTFDIFKNESYYYSLISNPENYSIKSILLYILFLPNVAIQNFLVAGCSQSWSVGVEEQFYIIWPFLIFITTRKKLLWAFFTLLLFFIFCHLLYQPFIFSKITSIIGFKLTIIPLIHNILILFPFEFMAIGAIGAYVFYYYNETIVFWTKFGFVYMFTLFAIFILMFFHVIPLYFQSVMLSIVFLCLILITINDKNNYTFRNKYLSNIGKISYGVYMFHPFIFFLIFPIANKYFLSDNNLLSYNLFIYCSILTLTFLLSHFSYKYFESIFINIKDTKYKSL
ncbi:acyltransferase family protein [Flavobacterium sp. 1355]|uniref:acyltransferase family protein n=1 Tax=Flavobacterium sp. 1355 TaxID=2806571 RepID=UPI001AE66111|nr:acyltransferase [Flavobacterium sp. 1355]MBP1224038.1 peptidoglycan/LPS O-acetylase OafA/YrhL [Flavobacterium sp. 1355]